MEEADRYANITIRRHRKNEQFNGEEISELRNLIDNNAMEVKHNDEFRCAYKPNLSTILERSEIETIPDQNEEKELQEVSVEEVRDQNPHENVEDVHEVFAEYMEVVEINLKAQKEDDVRPESDSPLHDNPPLDFMNDSYTQESTDQDNPPELPDINQDTVIVAGKVIKQIELTDMLFQMISILIGTIELEYPLVPDSTLFYIRNMISKQLKGEEVDIISAFANFNVDKFMGLLASDVVIKKIIKCKDNTHAKEENCLIVDGEKPCKNAK